MEMCGSRSREQHSQGSHLQRSRAQPATSSAHHKHFLKVFVASVWSLKTLQTETEGRDSCRHHDCAVQRLLVVKTDSAKLEKGHKSSEKILEASFTLK